MTEPSGTAAAQPDKTVDTSGGPVNTSSRAPATDENGCYTLPNGECVSDGPCLHTPPDAACARCGKTLSEDEPVYLIFDANSEVTGRLCEPCEESDG